MQGGGNDFMLINGADYSTPLKLDKKLIQRWSDRRIGVGFDQLLVINRPSLSSVDFDYQIFNADGSEAAQCGNGARCVAHFVTTKGLTDKKTIRVRTAERIIEMEMKDDNNIVVDMGTAIFKPERIPFDPVALAADDIHRAKNLYTLNYDGYTIYFSVLSFGNPHAVIKVDDIKTAAVSEIGSALQIHRCFPKSVNVSFVEVRDDVLHARVYERGVGETPACGSGACAIAVIARTQGWIARSLDHVSVQLTGGLLGIRFEKDKVKLVGTAELVYEGRIEA